MRRNEKVKSISQKKIKKSLNIAELRTDQTTCTSFGMVTCCVWEAPGCCPGPGPGAGCWENGCCCCGGGLVCDGIS